MSSSTQNSVDTSNVAEQFASLLATLSALKSNIRGLEAQVKSVEKNVRKQMRQLERESKKIKIRVIVKPLDLLFPPKFQKIYANLWESQKDFKWLELK